MASALSGVVTKAALFVLPHFAHKRELLSMTKYKLHEAGFIVIREEYRWVNNEMADTIAARLDQAAFLSGAAPPSGVESTASAHQMFTHSHATSVASGPQELVGNVYVYVLAHRECHTAMLHFLNTLFADDDYTSLLRNLQIEMTHDAAINQQPKEKLSSMCPLFCNATSIAAKQVVQMLFPRMMVHDVPNANVSREYVQAELKNALLPALVELSKAKPENPIRWLAERLLNTNVRAPPLIPAASVDSDVPPEVATQSK